MVPALDHLVGQTRGIPLRTWSGRKDQMPENVRQISSAVDQLPKHAPTLPQNGEPKLVMRFLSDRSTADLFVSL